jgi:hypothetical protein
LRALAVGLQRESLREREQEKVLFFSLWAGRTERELLCFFCLVVDESKRKCVTYRWLQRKGTENYILFIENFLLERENRKMGVKSKGVHLLL